MAAGFLSAGCRSHLDAAFDECFRLGRSNCALDLATIRIERDGRCCDCFAQRAVAEKEKALSGAYAGTPAELAKSLMRVRADYERATQCNGGRAGFGAAAREATQLYRDAMEDRELGQWIAITAIEDVDQRIDAVIAHQVFFKDRCTHDIAGEYQRYLVSSASRSAREIRRHLTGFASTPFMKDMFSIYVSRRAAEFNGPAEIAESEVLEQVRIELQGTPYADLAAARLWAKAAESEDPRQVEGLCQRLTTGAELQACRARAQELWAKAFVGASAKDLSEICPRLESAVRRAQCNEEFAGRALELIRENATAEDLALAEKACSNASERHQREWRIRLLRRDALLNYNRIVNREPQLRLELVESVGLWDDFVTVFDGVSRKVSDNHHESLRSIYPELSGWIAQRRANLVRRADAKYLAKAQSCRTILTKFEKDSRPEHVGRLNVCMSELADVLSMNEAHDHAEGLMNKIEAASCQLSAGHEKDWTTVVVPLLLSEALRTLVSPTFSQLAIRAMRAVDY